MVAAPVDDYVANRSSKAEFIQGLGDEAFFVNGADARQLWVLIDGKVYGEYPVVALDAVPLAGFIGRSVDTVKLWFN